MSARPRASMVEELCSAFARALDAVANAARGRKFSSTLERDVAELRERVERLRRREVRRGYAAP